MNNPQIGDVVTLASGNVPMTVEGFTAGSVEDPEYRVDVVWFDPHGKLCRDSFKPGMLRAAAKEP